MKYIKAFFSWKVVFIFFVLFAFIINALHESYPDEFDNILGGRYILQGKLPYSGFFTHHGPIPYFIASLIMLFGGQSFVRFRLIYAIFLLAFIFISYYILKKRLGKDTINFYPLFIAFLGVESVYYWMQMLLADNIAALSFLPVFALILIKALYKKSFTLFDVGVVSVFSALGLYSSLTYIYLFFIVVFSSLYLYFKNNYAAPLISKRNFYPFFILALPHFLFLFYLLITWSLLDYYYQNITFNSLYYIYNYPRVEGSTFINPLRYAYLIAHWFFMNFYTLLMGIKNFDFAFPVNMGMAVADFGLVMYLLLKKRYKLAIFLILVLTFTNVRSNVLTSKETDYQAGVYNLLSFFNMFFVLTVLYKDLGEKIATGKKVIFGALLFIVGAYSIFSFTHLLFKFNDRTISKYMGTMALIYDRPKLAPIVNSIIGKDEYAWIGPFEFEDLFYMNAKIPSKYHILISGVAQGEKTRTEMLSDFQKNKPKIIFFDKHFSYLGAIAEDYSKFFIEYLGKEYIILLTYNHNGKRYESTIPVDGELDLNANLYIRKDQAEEIIDRLLQKGYIKESRTTKSL